MSSSRISQENTPVENMQVEADPDIPFDFQSEPADDFPPFAVPFEAADPADLEEDRKWLMSLRDDDGYSPSELESKIAELNDSLASNAQELPDPNRTGESAARPELLKAIVGYKAAWVKAARALLEYKRNLTDRVWMKTAKTLSEWMGRSDRTVRQLISDYELTERSPKLMLAMQAAGCDPAAKHSYVKLLNEAVRTAAENPTMTEEQVVNRVIELKDPRQENYVKRTPAESRFWRLRLAIRTTLNELPKDERLELLAKAIGEEAYHVWKERAPFTISISPVKGVFTLDGRKPKQECPHEDH